LGSHQPAVSGGVRDRYPEPLLRSALGANADQWVLRTHDHPRLRGTIAGAGAGPEAVCLSSSWRSLVGGRTSSPGRATSITGIRSSGLCCRRRKPGRSWSRHALRRMPSTRRPRLASWHTCDFQRAYRTRRPRHARFPYSATSLISPSSVSWKRSLAFCSAT
jgi:hypothetical protein